MKRFYIFMLPFVLGASLTLHSQVDLNNGLLVHMPFTGNAKDSSGNGQHGTVNQASLTADRCGKANSAYSFNGTDAYIEIPSSTLQTQYYSYSLWVSAAEIPASGSYTYPLSIGNSGGGQNVALCNNSMQGWAGGSYNNGVPSASLVAIGSQPKTNRWYHIVFIRDTNKIKLFVDAELNTNEATYSGMNTSTGGNTANYGSSPKALIGNRDMLSQFYFKGSIDDIRIYNRVLNANEIDSLFHEKMCFFTGVDELMTNSSKVKVYPNPSKGEFTIDIENTLNKVKCSIVNIMGQEVFANVIEGSSTHISLSNMAPGIYTLILQDDLGTVSHKILVLN
jgi:hypothetical protein